MSDPAADVVPATGRLACGESLGTDPRNLGPAGPGFVKTSGSGWGVQVRDRTEVAAPRDGIEAPRGGDPLEKNGPDLSIETGPASPVNP